MSVNLTAGAIEALFNECPVENPVLQVMNIREYPPGKQGHTRYRLKLSDGVRSLSCFLLASQLNHLKEAELLEPNCVCMLKKTISSYLAKKRVLVVLDMDVLQTAADVGGKIGNPAQLTDKTADQQEAHRSTSSSDEIPGPSGYDTRSSCENSGIKSSLMKSSWKGSPVKGPGMPPPMKASPVKGPGMPPPMQASPVKAFGMASPVKRSGMPSPMPASPSPGPSQSPTKLTPIDDLNPYVSNWTVRARVTNKSDVCNWSNSRGEGKLFSFEVMDESGEIRITAFNSEVDKFFSLVEQNKLPIKRFTSLKNDYEITLGANSRIVPCDDDHDVPTVHYDFVPISQLEAKDPESIINVIGVCEEAGEVSLITTKAGKPLFKRALELTDASGKTVTLTLWGDKAQRFDASCHPVVAVKGARVSAFGGRSLSAPFSSTLMVNPDIPEAFELRAWYNQVGHGLCSQSLTEVRSPNGEFRTNWKSLSDVKTEQLGHDGKGRGECWSLSQLSTGQEAGHTLNWLPANRRAHRDKQPHPQSHLGAYYFSSVATVVYACKENALYRACPAGSCYKKVQERDDGRYHCDKCGKDYPVFKYRFMLSVNLADFGDNMWATCFQETAETLLGLNAEQLGHLKDTDEDAFNEVFQKVYFSSHIFRNRVKLEMYNDECRMRVTVMDVLPLDHRQYSRRLLNSVRALARDN
ncbi:replication protein A 70 kDa DNA-binding subunit-like isoform X2 [Syngnathoides biaculeatus]|uniref:replication protein A 70 kDa DNA-binding subunit-like isoform X2 n=1 Tax=Syngnathoides biaculeatus TaxID=300417 RepID=UPI002ADD516F|nr:replication protein A 70 kDa DNA-binding subunit-like isoform X2 [Syngnathoides biaculeatus]